MQDEEIKTDPAVATPILGNMISRGNQAFGSPARTFCELDSDLVSKLTTIGVDQKSHETRIGWKEDTDQRQFSR